MKIYSPIKGKLVSIEAVTDPVFAQKMMGEGVAIIPSDSKVVSPVEGTVVSVFPTKHAFGIETENGVEILIHIGLDTVELKGKHFDLKVEQGQKVTVGDVLVEVDFKGIEEAGFPIITPVVVLNQASHTEVTYDTERDIEVLDCIMELA